MPNNKVTCKVCKANFTMNASKFCTPCLDQFGFVGCREREKGPRGRAPKIKPVSKRQMSKPSSFYA